MFKPIVQCLEPSFRQTHQDIYLELNSTQYHYQVIASLETSSRSLVYTYTDLSDIAEMKNFRAMLPEKTGLNAIPQAEGYLTLSTCNTQGGEHQGVGNCCPCGGGTKIKCCPSGNGKREKIPNAHCASCAHIPVFLAPDTSSCAFRQEKRIPERKRIKE